MKKLVRATNNKVIGGVCAGLAEYFSIDPIIIRLIFVLAVVSHGGFVVLYVLLWMLTPKFSGESFRISYSEGYNAPSSENDAEAVGDEYFSTNINSGETSMNDTISSPARKSNMVGGVILITVGCILLANNFLPDIDVFDYWPLLLVGVGVGVLIRALRSNNEM